MNIVYLYIILFTSILSCAPIMPKILEIPFAQMNEPCFRFSEQFFFCDDITTAINFDPDKSDDIKNVCNQSKINNFTNDDLANLINYKFDNLGAPCNVHTINNLGSTQLRKHCPKIYEEQCVVGETVASLTPINNILSNLYK